MEIILNANILDVLVIVVIIIICIFTFRNLIDDFKYILNPVRYFDNRISDLKNRHGYLQEQRQRVIDGCNGPYSFGNMIVLLTRVFILVILAFEVCRIIGLI